MRRLDEEEDHCDPMEESYELYLEHFVICTSAYSATPASLKECHWFPVDEFAKFPQLQDFAILHRVQTPNWPQTFARRGLRFKDYSLTHRHIWPSTDPMHLTAPDDEEFRFLSLGGAPGVTFRKPVSGEGPLQGDVVVASRDELGIPCELLSISSISFPVLYSHHTDQVRFTTEASFLEGLTEVVDTEESLESIKELCASWTNLSFVHLARHLRPS